MTTFSIYLSPNIDKLANKVHKHGVWTLKLTSLWRIEQYQVLGLYSLSCKTSYRQISWSLEATRLDVLIIISLWNLTGISAALLPRCRCQISKRLEMFHSVESPSMVDPQWNIWYWGSKLNLHTVCWSEVGCEWGTTSVYFGITYFCFIPGRLPVFAAEPQYLLQYFLFLSKVSFELHIQNLQKISCWFKIWMGFVGPILIKLWTSSIWGFL